MLFTVGATDSPNNYDEAVIAVYSLATGERRTVIERASMARFVRRDQILFARAGSLFAIAFDPRRLETVGEAVPVIEDVGGDPEQRRRVLHRRARREPGVAGRGRRQRPTLC